MKSKNCKAPQCAFFSNHLLLPPTGIQIFSSSPYSWPQLSMEKKIHCLMMLSVTKSIQFWLQRDGWMECGALVKWYWQGERRVLTKTCPRATLFTTNPTHSVLESTQASTMWGRWWLTTLHIQTLPNLCNSSSAVSHVIKFTNACQIFSWRKDSTLRRQWSKGYCLTITQTVGGHAVASQVPICWQFGIKLHPLV